MRLGIVLGTGSLEAHELAGAAESVASAGFELLWLTAGEHEPFGALAAAAACAATTSDLLVGAQVPVGVSHPVYLAEERNVVDQLLGGRLLLGLHAVDDAAGAELAEWVEVLLAAAGTVPFAHVGPRHRIPAGLEANDVNPEERVILTPPPFSLDPQVWLSGVRADEVAATHAISLLDEDGDGERHWSRITGALGPAALRLRRPAVRDWDPTAEPATALAARLVLDRDTWGMDTALVRPAASPGTGAWLRSLADLQRLVRPRVQAHRLPAGLETYWDEQLSSTATDPTRDDPTATDPSTTDPARTTRAPRGD